MTEWQNKISGSKFLFLKFKNFIQIFTTQIIGKAVGFSNYKFFKECLSHTLCFLLVLLLALAPKLICFWGFGFCWGGKNKTFVSSIKLCAMRMCLPYLFLCPFIYSPSCLPPKVA